MRQYLMLGGIYVLLCALLFPMLTNATTDSHNGLDPIVNNVNRTKLENSKLKTRVERSNTPLYFITNMGQVNAEARFYVKAHNYTLWLTGKGLVFDKTRAFETGSINEDELFADNVPADNIKFERNVSRLMFLGANNNVKIDAGKITGYKVNYFTGNDQSKWYTDIKTSESVKYSNIYNGIDLKVYGIEKQIEYDWIIKPGADPSVIKFKYVNIKSIDIDTDGNLVINTEFGSLIHKRPVSYQVINGKKINVAVDFKKIGESTYGFHVKEYSAKYELIIDPLILDYSTYLGGSGHDYAYCIAVDSAGAAYISGYTGSTNYPIQNQYQSCPNASNAFVTKHSPSGNTLEYSTYLGGNNGEYGYAIAVDSTGAAYIAGYTYSTNFPTLNPYQTHQGNYDCFVTKLTPAGNALAYSTYIGGTSSDQAYAITIDSTGAAYITGTTYSTNYPCVNQYQTDQTGYDAFVSKLSAAGNTLIYSTYLGGNDRDYGYGIDVDSTGAAYVTGYTSSTDFPTVNQYQTDQASYDVFVTKLSPAGNTLTYSTYIGGSGSDYGRAIVVDSSNTAYITGYSYSSDYPCLNEYQSTNHGNADAIVTRLSSTGDSLLYSTYIGGSTNDEGHGIAIDSRHAIYVAGSTYSSDFPVENQYQTHQGNWDFFVTQFDPTGSSLIYSTYIGGTMGDYCNAMALDPSRNIYLAGYSGSTNFPVVNEYQTHQGNNDAIMIAVQWYIPNNAPTAAINADLFGGVAPVIITFDGSSSYDSDGSVVAWRWSFGDGSTGTGEIITHEYTTSGKFIATLQVKDDDDRWSAVASKQIVVFSASEISCDLKISPQSIKANGREVAQVTTTLYQNYSDGSAATPILYDLKLGFYTTNGTFLGINQFDSATGKYSDTLISGDPGQATVVAKLGEAEICTSQIDYTWPKSPVGLKVEIREDRSLLKAVLYIDFSWQENPDDTYPSSGFKFYRSTNGYEWETLSEIAPGTFVYTDEAVSVSNNYIYAVSKVDTNGDESEKAVFNLSL